MLKKIMEDIKQIDVKIDEAMDTKIDYKFEQDYEGIFVKFEIDDEDIEIRFEKYMESVIDSFYEISFTRNGSNKLMNKNVNSFKILGIVKNILFDFIKKYKPTSFYYSVSDNNFGRLKLYTRLANFIENETKFKFVNSNKILNKKSANFLFYKNEKDLNEIIKEYKRLFKIN